MSVETLSKTRMTADAFYDFVNRPENDNRWFVLVRGEVIELPPPTTVHGRVCSNVGFELETYVRRCGFGYVTSNDSGVLLEQDPDTVRGPDIALFEDAATFHPKYGEVVPILAVEVITPDTKAGKLASKIDDYLDNGVKLVWIVDIESRSVRIHTSDKRPITLKTDQELSGGDILPGFRYKVADFLSCPAKRLPNQRCDLTASLIVAR